MNTKVIEKQVGEVIEVVVNCNGIPGLKLEYEIIEDNQGTIDVEPVDVASEANSVPQSPSQYLKLS